MLIEEKADGMHQNEAQQAITQMPQITRPNALHLTKIRQLTKDGVDEVANTSQDWALIGCRLWRMRFAKWRLQRNAFGSQEGLQIRKPLVAITQYHAGCAFQQDGSDYSIRFMGGSQIQARQQARPTQLRMQTKAIKGVSIGMIFAIACLASKADAPGSSCKTIDRNGNTVDNRHRGIVADHFVTQGAPHALFDGPQIGRSPNKGAMMQTSQSGKKVRGVTLEVGRSVRIIGTISSIKQKHVIIKSSRFMGVLLRK